MTADDPIIGAPEPLSDGEFLKELAKSLEKDWKGHKEHDPRLNNPENNEAAKLVVARVRDIADRLKHITFVFDK